VSLQVVVEADGGSRGNPGPAGYGSVVLDATSGAVLAERMEYLGVETNNVAEYRGLIAGLEAAAELGADTVRVRMDSKLVVEQMSGRWQVKHPSMRPLARRAAALAGGFSHVTYEWIPRAQNSYADRLANTAMDAGTLGSQPDPVRSAPPTASAAGTAATAEAAGQLLLPAVQPAVRARVSEARQQSQRPTPQAAWIPPDSTPTRFILVRHGVTEHSVARVFAGRSDLPLTDDGRQQAVRTALRVTALGPVDAVVSSPLQRTRQTAAAIATALGLDVDFDEDLIETDFGAWDGFSFAEVRQKWPDELSAWSADPAVAPPGGESFESVTRRVRRARDRILAAHVGSSVVVVSHVTPIKVLVRLALDAPSAALYKMFLEPASISVIDYFTEGPTILRSFNDSAHV